MESAIGELGKFPVYIMGGYLVLLLCLGVAGWLRSRNDEEDYYLAGRQQGWIISSVTIMATFFSSFALLGAPGMVYREGIMFVFFSLNVPVAGVCVYLFGSRIWKAGRDSGYVTPGDMVSDYYGSRVALKLLVAATCTLYVLPYVVMQIKAGGVLSAKLFPGNYHLSIGSWTIFESVSSYSLGAFVLAAITMVYIMIGGMRSVAWTDLIQGILLIVGMLVSGMAMLIVFDSPAEFGRRLTEDLPESSLTIPGNTGTWEWTMLFTVCAVGSVGSMVQPAQWMRFYSASSPAVLKRGAAILAVVLTSCFIFGVMLIGLAGQILYPLNFTLTEEAPAEVAETELETRTTGIVFEDGHEFEVDQATGEMKWSWSGKKSREMSDSQRTRIEAVLTEGQIAALGTLQAKSRDETVRPAVSPHNAIQDYDSILVAIISTELPRHFHAAGAIVASLILVAIMAASMSTADSNLHAVSAVATRDIYDQFIRPNASEAERIWFGRFVIASVTALALWAVIGGNDPELRQKYDVLAMIAQLGLTAMAFSAQLLPVTFDMLFIQRGTRMGAIVGLAGGLVATFMSGPLFGLLVEACGRPSSLVGIQAQIESITTSLRMHGSVWGLLVNVPLFVIVSTLGRENRSLSGKS